MKMKKTMRVLTILVVFSILLAATAFAAPARASAYLSAYYATITKTSTGDLSIHFQVIAPAIMDQLGVSRIAVQRYTGSYWRTEYNLHTRKRWNCKAKMLEFIPKQCCIHRNTPTPAIAQLSNFMRQIPADTIREFIQQIKPIYKEITMPPHQVYR